LPLEDPLENRSKNQPAGDRNALLLAIDQGTSSSRAVVFDTSGGLRGQGQVDFASSFPADGWVEQDPEVLWETTVSSVKEALQNARVSASDIRGLGITNQRETTLLWERDTGKCLYPAIVWQDGRTIEQCTQLREQGHTELIRATTGLVVDPYFSATKLTWLLDNVANARDRAERGELCFNQRISYATLRPQRGKLERGDA